MTIRILIAGADLISVNRNQAQQTTKRATIIGCRQHTPQIQRIISNCQDKILRWSIISKSKMQWDIKKDWQDIETFKKPVQMHTGDDAGSRDGRTIRTRRRERTQAINHLKPKKSHVWQRKGSSGTQEWPGQQKLRRHDDVSSLFLADKIVTRTDFSINLRQI